MQSQTLERWHHAAVNRLCGHLTAALFHALVLIILPTGNFESTIGWLYFGRVGLVDKAANHIARRKTPDEHETKHILDRYGGHHQGRLGKVVDPVCVEARLAQQ
jgi:hypothetical protein